MQFRGRTPRSLDPKGRLMLPQDFRESLLARGHSVVSGGTVAGDEISNAAQAAPLKFALTTYDGCLVAYPWNEWVEIENNFARLTNSSEVVRKFRRLFIGGAEVHTPDAQGRILLSADHREYAGLSKDALLVGLIDRFEIWNPSAYKLSLENQTLDNVAAELAASGIAFPL